MLWEDSSAEGRGKAESDGRIMELPDPGRPSLTLHANL